MCGTEDDADCKENGVTSADQVKWCGNEDDNVDEMLTCAAHGVDGAPTGGSTCKTKIQCVKTFLGGIIRPFAAVMACFLFLESTMVVGTFKLALKASQGGDSWCGLFAFLLVSSRSFRSIFAHFWGQVRGLG